MTTDDLHRVTGFEFGTVVDSGTGTSPSGKPIGTYSLPMEMEPSNWDPPGPGTLRFDIAADDETLSAVASGLLVGDGEGYAFVNGHRVRLVILGVGPAGEDHGKR